MSISQKAAKTLAVSYQAYMEYANTDDALGMIVWGPILLAAQVKTGVQLQDPDNVARRVARARIERDAAEAKEVQVTLDYLDAEATAHAAAQTY
jgi:hypothetical protein